MMDYSVEKSYLTNALIMNPLWNPRHRLMRENGCEPEHWHRSWNRSDDELDKLNELGLNAPPLWDELSPPYRTVIQIMEGTRDEAEARTKWNNFNHFRKREWFKEPIAFTWKPDGTITQHLRPGGHASSVLNINPYMVYE